MVSWREQPTRYDIQALQANIRRVGLVVRVRWILIVVLVAYSLIGGGLYLTDDRIPVSELARLMIIPAMALGFVVLYNAFYHFNYRRLGNIAVWNTLQLILDTMVVTVLVYYSGGATSWFWSMYSLFILEATFILPRSRSAWLIAGTASVLLGTVELAEFLGWLPHIRIPFSQPGLHTDSIYVLVRYLWQIAVLVGTASVSTALVGEFRTVLASRFSQQIVDEETGLFSRQFFMRSCATEIHRALRDGRSVYVMLIDIDRFSEFNGRFGFDAGDRLLSALAREFAREVSAAGETSVSANVVARYGGEEFAVLFAEDARSDGAITRSDAMSLAEQLRFAASAVRIDGAGVTVSIGLASMPGDGGSLDAVLDAADAALACAAENGNRVSTASECSDAEGPPVE